MLRDVAHGHRRRNPRGGRRQARRAPGALARAARRAGRPCPCTRIGLSATQKPIEVVAQFLAGAGRPAPVVVQVAPRRALDLAVEVPPSELGPVASNELWDEIYDRIAALVQQHRSTLVFVNTRRLAERVAHHLAERLGASAVAAHHGSLSRKMRLDAEQRLKAGELRALVATASLELGIDVGTIDLVCQIGSPRSIAVGGAARRPRGPLARRRPEGPVLRDHARRAGRMRGARAARSGAASSTGSSIPDAPLDVLAQQIVAMCAADDWGEDDLFALVRRAYPYRDLVARRVRRDRRDAARRHRGPARTLRRVPASRSRERPRARRGAARGSPRSPSGGAIPDTGALHRRRRAGRHDRRHGRRGLRGREHGRRRHAARQHVVADPPRDAAGRVLVEDAHGASPTIPFWRGEAPARTAELSRHVAEVRDTVSEPRAATSMPADASRSAPAAAAAVDWLDDRMRPRSRRRRADRRLRRRRPRRARRRADRTTRHRRAVLRRGRRHAARHPRAVRRAHQQGLGPGAAQAILPLVQLRAAGRGDRQRHQHRARRAAQLSARRRLPVPAARRRCARCSSRPRSPSPIFGTRWRWDASRALALLRFRGGKKVPDSHPAAAVGRPAGRRCSPTSPRVRRTSKATSRFPIIRSSAK